MVLITEKNGSLIKSLSKIFNEIEYQALVARDYSNEIHMDPDKLDLTDDLEKIRDTIINIKIKIFDVIEDNINELLNELSQEVDCSTSDPTQV